MNLHSPCTIAPSSPSFSIHTVTVAAAVARREAWLADHEVFGVRGASTWIRERKQNADAEVVELDQLLHDTDLYWKLILTMALDRPKHTVRDGNGRPRQTPPRIITEGFFWKDYPSLETMLYQHMGEYYEWSTQQRQSKNQQAFNNALVDKIRMAAVAQGHVFDVDHFTDKRLRDRIRCFFKTHLQNAKKRLHTMRKHLDSADMRQSLKRLIHQAQEQQQAGASAVRLISTEDDNNGDGGDLVRTVSAESVDEPIKEKRSLDLKDEAEALQHRVKKRRRLSDETAATAAESCTEEDDPQREDGPELTTSTKAKTTTAKASVNKAGRDTLTAAMALAVVAVTKDARDDQNKRNTIDTHGDYGSPVKRHFV